MYFNTSIYTKNSFDYHFSHVQTLSKYIKKSVSFNNDADLWSDTSYPSGTSYPTLFMRWFICVWTGLFAPLGCLHIISVLLHAVQQCIDENGGFVLCFD